MGIYAFIWKSKSSSPSSQRKLRSSAFQPRLSASKNQSHWIPAFAGMTTRRVGGSGELCRYPCPKEEGRYSIHYRQHALIRTKTAAAHLEDRQALRCNNRSEQTLQVTAEELASGMSIF